jgi:hypothetical protein
MNNTQAVHHIEALGGKRREAQVGLYEIGAVSFSRRRHVDRGAHVHPDDVGTGLSRVMEPASHATAGIQHLESLPPYGLGPVEIPVEDALVYLEQLGEPLPLVTEGPKSP